jgi:hypothetical protein
MLPPHPWRSTLRILTTPQRTKADAVDGAIGELSPFHEMNGVYAQGVSVRTAVLPEGWRGRVVPWSNQSTGRALAAFLEPHDCVVSKLVAYREKDFAFAAAMLESGLVDPTILAREPGSAGTGEAAFMVEGLGRPTPTRRV